MSKKINCLVDTYSKKEREELSAYLHKREKFASITDNSEGFQTLSIAYDHDAGFLIPVIYACFDEGEELTLRHFKSKDEYIAFREEK